MSAPGTRNGFLMGLAAGVIIAAAVWLLVLQRPKAPAPQPAPVTATVPAPSAPEAMPPDPPPVSEAEMAAAPRITAVEAKALADADRAVFIDVRDVESYRAGHIPGALQIPLQYVPGEIPWFPKDRRLIPYCT